MIKTLLTIASLLIAAPLRADQPVTIFAASSLQNALDEVITGQNAVVSYGGSAAQARQVAAGAPADIVFLASPEWMDWLDQQGVIKAPEIALRNRLVMVGTGAEVMNLTPEVFQSILGNGKLALGETKSVPAGQYARAYLEKAGLWHLAEPYLVETDNVRATLALVSRQEAEAGFVYRTDAALVPQLDVLYLVPEDMTPPIVYPIALTKSASAAANRVFAHIQSQEAAQIFARYGFVTRINE